MDQGHRRTDAALASAPALRAYMAAVKPPSTVMISPLT